MKKFWKVFGILVGLYVVGCFVKQLALKFKSDI